MDYEIIELIIDENDTQAGLDGIALVNNPAIEVDFQYFNKEESDDDLSLPCNHYVLAEEQVPKVIEMFSTYGEKQSDLIKDGFKIVKVKKVGKQAFADITSEPNKDSEIADTPTLRIRYKYVGPKDEKNRIFCGEMMKLNRVFRREDIISMSNKNVNEIGPDGYDIFEWRGSYNCRHAWVELTYVKEGSIINNAKVTRGLITEDGVPGPDTRTTATINAGNTPPRNAFDNMSFANELYDFEESITDYPQFIKDNAAKALKYFEESGNPNNCMTQVGKVRMNQLAKGDPLSLNTVKRMKAYISRHTKDLQASKSYEDGCGLLSMDAWGGVEALDWTERTIKKYEEMSKAIEEDEGYKFSIADDEERILVGPVMIPQKMMIRRNPITNSKYFVYFTEETIKQLQEKYMKDKLLDATNIEHSDNMVKDVTLIESWIVEDEQYDKQKKFGYDNPIGTWMVKIKVNNNDVWKQIKEKKLKGFSVQGYFSEKKMGFIDL